MIKPENFYNTLIENGTDFFTGVPDSLLKNICSYITDTTPESKHIIAANEGSATALAAGYHFATSKIPLVYMQNSGIGNAVNPLLSLVDPDVYSIPMMLLIGWRGEPGVKDEPQHLKQGKVTCTLFEAMDIPYTVLSTEESDLESQIKRAYAYIKEHKAPYALIVKKDTFAEYKLQKKEKEISELKREDAIEKIILTADKTTAVVSTTGMISRELYELREKHAMSHETDFLTVGSMGHSSQIAYAIASQNAERMVYCIDGDGASIMQMGGLTTIGSGKVKNLVHFVLNNGAHDSVGGQPTVGYKIDLPKIAQACGYSYVTSISTISELESVLTEISEKKSQNKSELSFIEIKVCKGARKDLGRPKSTPVENKDAFMAFLNNKNGENND